MKNITLTQVAVRAGVSLSTVSKVLNGTEKMSPETTARIMQAAEELGYKPNRAAQYLASKNKSIGIIMPYDPPEVYSQYEAGIQDALREYRGFGFRAELLHYHRCSGKEEFAECLYSLHGKVQGLLYSFDYEYQRYEALLEAVHIPKISFQNTVKPSLGSSVTVDDYAVGRMAAEFLWLCGHGAKTAVIAGDSSFVIHRNNINGFRDYIADKPMQLVRVIDSNDDFGRSYEAAETLLQSVPGLSGIFVSTYTAPAVCACLRDHGALAQVRVIGVDIFDRSAACLSDGSLSAVIYQNQREQARCAFSTLIDRMHDYSGAETVRSIKIKPELILFSNLDYYYDYHDGKDE